MGKKEFTASDLKIDATIGIFGHYGVGNLGDESIIAAVIQNIVRRLPKAKIVCFSSNPADTTKRYNVEAHPVRYNSYAPQTPQTPSTSSSDVRYGEEDQRHNFDYCGKLPRVYQNTKSYIKRSRVGASLVSTVGKIVRSISTFFGELRFLRRSYRALGGVDVLMITGSNQFLDNFGGPWGFPYTLLKWSMMAKLSGTHVIYVSVGAGPIESKLSMLMIRLAVKPSAYTSLRDGPSQDLIRAIGVKSETSVYPDLAYSLYTSPTPLKRTRQRPDNEKPTVGINPMPVYDRRYWYLEDDRKYANYVTNLAKFAAVLMREDYPLVFWGTQPKDQNVIADVLARVQSELKMDIHSTNLVATSNTVDELFELIRTFDIIVPTRFHGTLLPLSAYKPVLSICYYRKTDDLMKEMDQSEYSVWLDTMDWENLLIRFKNLERNMDREIDKIKSKTDEYRQALNGQYDYLFGQSSQVSKEKR